MLTEDRNRFFSVEYAVKKYNQKEGEKIEYFTIGSENDFSKRINTIHKNAWDLKYSPLLEKYKDTLVFNNTYYTEVKIVKRDEIYILEGKNRYGDKRVEKIEWGLVSNEVSDTSKGIKEKFRDCTFNDAEKLHYQKEINGVVKEAQKQYSSLPSDNREPIVEFADILDLSKFNTILRDHELEKKIKEVQKKLTKHECKALIFNDGEFHATLCLVTKEKLVFLPMIGLDSQRIRHPLTDKGFSVIQLDREKFYITKGGKAIQMDKYSCHMLAFNIAKQMLKPRTDGKEGLIIHQALETLREKDNDIKIANLPQEVQDKIMKYSQPIYDNIYVKDLPKKLQGEIIHDMMAHDDASKYEDKDKPDAIKGIALQALPEELRTKHLAPINQSYKTPILNAKLIKKLENGGFIKDGKNTYLEYQTFKYDQLHQYKEFLKTPHTPEEKKTFRDELETERKFPFSDVVLPNKVHTHLHKFDAKNFLLKLERKWIKEDKDTFEENFQGRFTNFKNVCEGTKSLSANEISHLSKEEQKDVASKALKLLERAQKHKASDPDTNIFLSKLEKAWTKEHPSTFKAKFERRVKRFNDIVEGRKSLSANYISYDITNLDSTNQKDVANTALKLLRKCKDNIGVRK